MEVAKNIQYNNMSQVNRFPQNALGAQQITFLFIIHPLCATFSPSLNQYSDYILRFLLNRAFIEVSTLPKIDNTPLRKWSRSTVESC